MYEFGIITNEELVEGIVASVIFAITGYFLKYILKLHYLLYITLPWLITWIFRKMSVHIFNKLQKEKYVDNKLYSITI